MRCQKCNGFVVMEREDDMRQLRCQNCGLVKFLDPIQAPQPREVRRPRFLDDLPDQFRLIDVLRRLWNTELAWTARDLREYLVSRGYKIYRDRPSKGSEGVLVAVRVNTAEKEPVTVSS